MEISSSTTLLSVFFFVVTGTIIFRFLVLKKQNKLLHRQLNDSLNSVAKIREELEDLHKEHHKIKQFQNSLAEAELTTKLQKPRLSSQASPTQSSTPEKYRFVHSLTAQGMGVQEIASVLSVSSYEAEQLVTLAKLGKKN